MEENTIPLESSTGIESGTTDHEKTNTASEDNAVGGDETPTTFEGGKTDREKNRTGPADTWTVRGVDVETRRAAKLAAKREGKFLGDWLNDTIRTAATATLKRSTVPARPEDVTDVLQRLLDARLQPITEQLKALSEQRTPAPPPPTFWQRLTGRA